MPNSYFQFKQFTINQDKCAMKVCTDSCLFGAIVAIELQHKTNVLDIGLGTGLLSLMYAQKNESKIDGIEINQEAFLQAKENIEASSFNKIHLINDDVLKYESNSKYDLIICNPPFFKNSLKSDKADRNVALHNDELSYEKLIFQAKSLLETSGTLAILIAYIEEKNVLNVLKINQLYCYKIFRIKQTNQHNFFRSILFISISNLHLQEIELSIKDDCNQYTQEFVNYLKDYYLFF